MKLALSLAAFLALGGASFATSCQAQPPYEQVHRTSVRLEVPLGSCSGTAVQRYVLLSASHCFPDTPSVIVVNGKVCEVLAIKHDGADHALVTISRTCPQKHVARIARTPVKPGDEVFVWGAPGDFHDLLRVCRVVGEQLLSREEAQEWPVLAHPVTLLDGAIGKGDSGAGVFNANGELVGVISFGTMDHTFPPNLFAGMVQIQFTRAQLRGR